MVIDPFKELLHLLLMVDTVILGIAGGKLELVDAVFLLCSF